MPYHAYFHHGVRNLATPEWIQALVEAAVVSIPPVTIHQIRNLPSHTFLAGHGANASQRRPRKGRYRYIGQLAAAKEI